MTDELEIVDNPDRHRFEARLGGEVVGFATYRLAGSTLTFLHTEVGVEYEGRGYGSRLAAGALHDVRARQLRIDVRCPFIAAYLRRHPGERDLLVTSHASDRTTPDSR